MAGNLGTTHAQYVRRGNAPNLNDQRPLPGSFELGGLAPGEFTIRRRNFTGKCFVNQALARKTCGGVT